MDYTVKNIQSRTPVEQYVDLTSGGMTAKVHPFWGVSFVNANNLVSATDNQIELSFTDKFNRDLGISRQIDANNRILKALSNPAEYLQRKNVDIQNIGTASAAIYRDEYVKNFNKGYTQEEASNRAMELANMTTEFKLREHEEEFPTVLTEQIYGRLNLRNAQGNLPN